MYNYVMYMYSYVHIIPSLYRKPVEIISLSHQIVGVGGWHTVTLCCECGSLYQESDVICCPHMAYTVY